MRLLRTLITLFRRDKFTTFQEGYLEEGKQNTLEKKSLSKNEYIFMILLILFNFIFLFGRSVLNWYRWRTSAFLSNYGLLMYVLLWWGGFILIFWLIITSLALPIHYLINRRFNLLALVWLVSSPFFIFIIWLIFDTLDNRNDYY